MLTIETFRDGELEFTARYQLIATSAPVEYDYQYCIPLRHGYFEHDRLGVQECRFVLIPVDRVAYQTGRYRSGLYWAEDAEGSDVAASAFVWKTLHERLRAAPVESR